jgi:hypothetical protein
MKKHILFMGIPAMMLVFGMALLGCNNGSTDGDIQPGSIRHGTITIVGINPQYNGRYATFRASSSAEPEGGGYLVTTIGNNGMSFDGALIADGSITIPVYLVPYDSNQFESYGRSDSGIKIYVNPESVQKSD